MKNNREGKGADWGRTTREQSREKEGEKQPQQWSWLGLNVGDGGASSHSIGTPEVIVMNVRSL